MALLEFLLKVAKFLVPFWKRRKRYLLIVEDNQNDVTLFMACVPEGIECDVANTCEEAAGMMKSKPYSIVFLDCRMPSMQGHELYKIIRDRHPNICIVITPSVTQDLDKFPKSEPITVIIKPVTAHSIKHILKAGC
jgi:DNA-binding NtrC family response regulator